LIDNQHNLELPEGVEEQEGGSGPSKLRTFLIETIETIILAAVLFVVINTFTARIRVDGPSMEPSFYHNDHVIVNRWAYKLGDIERGDVVVFPFPHLPDEDFIKRVIGLPGDKIEVFNGIVYVNDYPIEEPYVMASPTRDYMERFVPEGMVFVMGDNRNNSSDSREWGFLSIDDIIGKAIFVYWPITGFGVVEHYDVIVGDSW
jgi:signal peptidase I